MTSGYSPHRRDDRQRPPLRAVPARRRTTSRTATPSAATRSRAAVALANLDIFEREGINAARARRTRARSAPRWRSSTTCRSSATSAATGYFYGIELVKDKATKETFDDDESERLLRGFLSKALFDAGLYCRADDRGDPVVQLAPPLIIGQPEFDEIEQILRSVLTEAWSIL